MRAVRVVIADADFQVFRELVLDGEICLLAERVLEALLDRDGERQERERKSGGEEILVREERIGLKGIEALLAGFVAHGGKGSGTAGEIACEQALENIGGVEGEWVRIRVA